MRVVSFDSETSSRSSRPSSKVSIRDCLADLTLPPGLLSSVLQRYQTCDSWLWIVDNSSFMKVRDAHVKQVGSGGAIKRLDGVSRWQELQETLVTHAKLSSKVWMPTKYRLINEPTGKAAGEPHRFEMCWSSRAKQDSNETMSRIKTIFANDSLGCAECRLTSRVESLRKGISNEAPTLLEENKRLTVVICTQGTPTNSKGQTSKAIRQEFEQEIEKLSKLPVKIVVRLTTGDDKVVEMYSDMCARFDGIDVLDNWWGEAMEVYLHNPWLTYSLGLHRLREAGLAPDIFSVLNGRALTLDEIHQLSELLFLGEDGSGIIPHPPYQPIRVAQLRRVSWLTNWTPFITGMKNLIDKQKLQWNPIKKKMTPWIDLKKLESNLRGQLNAKSPLPRSISNVQDSSSRSDFTRRILTKSRQQNEDIAYKPAASNHRFDKKTRFHLCKNKSTMAKDAAKKLAI